MGLLRRVAVLATAAVLLLVWAGTTVSPASASGTWGALGTGANLTVNALAVAPNETLYIGGNFGSPGTRVAKWNGSTWSALGTGVDNLVYDLAVDGNNTLYVGGAFTTAGSTTANYIARWNDLNSSWSALSTGTNAAVTDMAVAPNGTLYIGGGFSTAGGNPANFIAQWNGSTWSTLSSGTNAVVTALATDSSGNVYVGGNFSTAGGVMANRIARWNGSTWSALGTGLNDNVRALATDSSGNVYAVGDFTTAGGVSANRVAMWNGSTWSALGSGLDAGVTNVAVAPNGTVYAGGTFTTAGGSSANYITQWNGSTWSALGSGMNSSVNDVAVGSTGTLYAGGTFTTAGGVSASRIATWSPWPAALTPTFDTPVRSAGGFTVNVTNYDAAYTWTPTVGSGSVSAGTASGSTLPLTVTGVSAGASSTVTVTTSRSGYSDASSTVTGQAKGTQTVTWSPTTAVTTVQSPLTPSVSATALGGAPISYAVVAGFTTSTCSVDSSTGQLTYTGTGACTVRATAASTSAYLEGTTDVTFTVSRAAQTVTWSPTTAVTTVQSPVTPTLATALGGAPISYAKVSNTTTTCTVDPTSGQLAYTGPGSCVVRATAAATDLYNAGSADVTFTVSKATPSLTWAPATTFTVPDGSTTFAAATTTSDGAVSYFLTTNTAGCTLSGRVLSFTQQGSCGVTASVAATDTYNAASTVSTFAISKAAQTVTWAPSSTLTLASLSATLPTGSTSGDGAITYAVTSAGGTGCAFANPTSPVLTYSTVGTCSVTATAASTTAYSQGTQSASITITLATPTMTWTPSTALFMPAATVNPAVATTTSNGAITYAVTSGSNCSVDTNTGAFTYTTTGPCQVTATSAATSRYAAGSIAVTFTVSLAPQTITGAASATSLQPGGTAILTNSGSTGTGPIIWTLTSGAGVCSLAGSTVTAITGGTCTLTVSIAADPTYAAASNTLTITVTTPGGGGGGGGGGSGGSGGSGGGTAPAASGSTSVASGPGPVSTDVVRPPGAMSPTTGRALPPPPRVLEVTPLPGRARAKVLVGLPEGAAGTSVLSTVVVVRDSAGTVVSRSVLPVRPGQQQTEVVVPYVADDYSVNVYNVNEVGVSAGALNASPLVHATTITRRSTTGSPTLFGTRVGRPVTFAGGSASLDARDRKQLRAIARSAKQSPDRLFVTGFARKGGTGTPSELASLSTTRARNVAAYLAQQGVRVWIRYWGAGTLNGTGSTSDRRVEIHTSNQPIPGSLVP